MKKVIGMNDSQMPFQKGKQLSNMCDYIIRELDDPLVLHTAYLERAILRKTKSGAEWVKAIVELNYSNI